MTANEQKLLNAAQSLTEAGNTIADGVQALKDKIAELQGVEVEDLSDEFATLDSAVANISAIGTGLTPAPAGTPADPSQPTPPAPVEDPLEGAGPLDHPEIAPDPLGGPTDAGVPTSVSQPGTGGNTEGTPTTPVVEDAQAEANPTLGPSEGSGSGTEGDPPEPVADESGEATENPAGAGTAGTGDHDGFDS